MKAFHKIFFFFMLIGIFASCSSKNKEEIVAKAFDYYLYKSELKGIIPKGSTKNDSIAITKNFINNWIHQKIILHKAEKNLTEEQKDFTAQIENYRNSLLVYSYESKLIMQLLDTAVTNAQIQEYYEKNTDNFLLKDNIIKVNYVKLTKNSAIKEKVKSMLFSEKDNKNQLLDICSKQAVNFFLEDNEWLLFNDLLKEIPIETYNQESFLKSNRTLEIKDDNYIYLINIKDFKIKESTSPLSFEKDNIRNIILNKRKLLLINKMHDELFDEAVKSNEFKIY
ncbi:MAG: hypothetical protein NTZ33_00295 [Bacteroidetes bacterium]|nr:hypothetical protein [Bacteroidota bacterium]